MRPDRPLALLLVAFIAIAAAMSALIPLGEAADEPSHYSYVRYIATHGTPPPVVPNTTVLGETFQPPLYYALAAPLTAWLPPGNPDNLGLTLPIEANPDVELGNPTRTRLQLQPAAARWPWQGEALGWHLVRFLSALLGAVTVWATFGLAREVFPDEPSVAWLAALLTAFLPSFVALSAAVTNDALLTTLCALLLWQAARLVTGHAQGWRAWVLIGLLGGLAVWTKASGWFLVPTVILAALLTPTTKSLRDRMVAVATAGGTWLLLALPLWGLNLTRSGDIMGRGLQAQVTEARTALSLGDLGVTLYGLYRSWWAGFGGANHISFPVAVNLLLLIPLAVAGWGLLRRHLARASAPAATRALIPLLAAHIAVIVGAWLLWTTLVMGTSQGRLLFPALPAMMVLLAGGLGIFDFRFPIAESLPQSRAWSAPWLWGGGMALLLAAAVATLLVPAFRRAPERTPIPPNAATESWQVGELPLQLVAFASPLSIDDRHRPPDETTLYVAWRATGPLPDVRLRLRWVSGDGPAMFIKESAPLAAPPLSDEWAAGDYGAWHRVALPQGLASGYQRLRLSVVDHRTGRAYPLLLDGQPAGDEIMVGQTTVVP